MSTGSDEFRLADAGIRLDSMPIAGRDLELRVSEDERRQLAELLHLTAISQLDVTVHAARFRGGMRVTGRLVAAIEQPSVVTLEPVTQAIDEPIDRVLLPFGARPRGGGAPAEIFVDPEGEDPPDHFDGPEADLSALIIETLALAIDPYPRAPGESLDALGVAGGDADDSPFASLRTLKPGNKA